MIFDRSMLILTRHNINHARQIKKALFGCNLKLWLVHVKYFLKNIYFLEMLFFGKVNIFKCLSVL